MPMVDPATLLAEPTTVGSAAWAAPSLPSNASRKAAVGARDVHGNSEANQAEAAAEGPRPKQAKYVLESEWLWWIMVVALVGHGWVCC